MNYSIFNSLTGEIEKVVNCHPVMIESQIAPGQSYVEGGYDDTLYYIVNNLPQERPEMPCSVAGMTISNIPVGAQCFVDNQEPITINDGLLIISPEYPCTTHVKLCLFPYQDWKVSLDFSG